MSGQTFIIVDTNNLYFRSRFSVRGDIDTKIGMSFHVLLMSLRKMWNKYDGSHIIFTGEGKSWRYKYDDKYKIQRKLNRLVKTEQDQEDDAIFMEALSDFQDFIENKTNCTYIRAENAEADDVIALWIQSHPEDNHIIISSDTDFIQLLAPNVIIHDGVNSRTLKHDGVYDDSGRKLEFTIASDGKIKTGKPNPNFLPDRKDWIEYALFLKIIRGDTSDSIFSAYPGARLRGTKNKVGITEAFEDRKTQGYNYNNFMNQRWVDPDGEECRVRDRFAHNQLLIDLTKHPDQVRKHVCESINSALQKEVVKGVGIHFLKFCSRWDLAKISQYPEDFARILQAKYKP